MDQTTRPNDPDGNKRIRILAAWALMLLVSDVPDILSHHACGSVPVWLFWIKMGLIAVFALACPLVKSIRPLWQFAVVFLVFYVAIQTSAWVGDTSWWQGRFGGSEVSFTSGYVGIYIRDVGLALAVIATLWVLKRRRSEFFLVTGRLDAPIEPVRWLGIRAGESWRTFGWIIALIAGAGVAIPMALSARPTIETLSRAAPLLPAALLFAAVNAFTEEIYFRASFLSTLHELVGKQHALLITSVYFGLNHWLYGSPPGLVGFLMTGFLAWLLAKSMLETKGLLWPWFIHFVPDAVIFATYAILWVQR
ncbi:MAG: CPBP family intramembrane glutamic endopeptidase [Acidobacteriota bacterium]